MAFAGAPDSYPDDFERAINACRDTSLMLKAEKDTIEKLWGEPFNIRSSVVECLATISFFGKGFKSFTPRGIGVSFAHRLCSEPKPWTAAVYSFINEKTAEIHFDKYKYTSRETQGLKGLKRKIFDVYYLEFSDSSESVLNFGPCKTCGTIQAGETTNLGFIKVYCPMGRIQNSH